MFYVLFLLQDAGLLSSAAALASGLLYAVVLLLASLAAHRRRRATDLARSILILLVGGTIAGMFFAGPESAWQKISLSALGGVYSRAPILFNTTMVCAALSVVSLGSILFHPEVRLQPNHLELTRTRKFMRAATVVLCLQFLVIGTIPYNVGALAFWIHTAAGWGAALIFISAMGLSRLLFPTFSRQFHIGSQALAGVAAIAALLHRPGFVLSLIHAEILISVVVLAWIGWFVSSWAGAVAGETSPVVAAGETP